MCGNDSFIQPTPPPPPPPRTFCALPDVIPSVALAATLLLTGAPALAVLNCEPAQRGTLGTDGVTFTPGTSASDIDILFTCTGDGAGDEITTDGIVDIYDDYLAAGGDDVLDPHVIKGTGVLEVGGDGARIHFDDLDEPYTNGVFKGTIRGADDGAGIDVDFESNTPDVLHWDFHADIRTTGGARGILVYVNDDALDHRVRLVRMRNFGSIVTEDAGEARRGDAMVVWVNHADVEATNEAGATIETSGNGDRGLAASTNGIGATAKAVNRGEITTTGDLDDNDRGADAVRADNDGPDRRTAEVVNEAGATIRTEGDGARGLLASSCNWDGARCIRSGEGSATAINRGSVTTTGDGAARSNGGIRNAHAVYAYLDGDGTARAVNEAGGTIRTEGTGARGLSAIHEGSLGLAEAENEGDITTTGGMDSALRPSYGLHAFSQERSARAVNHEGATIVTRGVAARGMSAIIDRGTADDSATAINHGSITTHGDGFFNEDIDDYAQGVVAYAGLADEEGTVSSATALNDETGTVETHGRGAMGVIAGTAGSGDAESVNRGRITTRGDAFPIDRQNDDRDDFAIAGGLAAVTLGSGSASARNEVDGIVETHGTVAIGLAAWSEGGGTASVVNQGRVTTHQTAAVDDLPRYVGTPFGAYGAWTWSVSDALVENEETGRVETMGAWAAGLFAEIENDGSRESVVARVDNRGTVITHGPNADGVAAVTHGPDTDGVDAIANDGGPVDNAGDATVVNTGRVTVNGARARGLYTGTSGRTGAATVTLTGGEVTASHADDPATGDVDEGGVGILAETSDAGSIAVRIEDGARVDAPTAVRLVGGSGIDAVALDVIGSTLTGRVDLTQAVNGARLTVAGGSVIDGAVDFGAGDDELVMQGGGLSSIEGTVRGLETMYKRGAGAARVNDAVFSGSAVNLEEGDLILAGHLNLGEEGTVTVHDDSRLVIEVGDIVADGNRHGRITAGGGVVFQGEDDPAMSIQIAFAAREQEEAIRTRLQETSIDVLGDGTDVTQRATAEGDATPVDEVDLKTGTGSEERDIGAVDIGEDTHGITMVQPDAGPIEVAREPFAPEPSTPSSGGGGGKAAAFVGGGVLLGALLFDWFDSEDEAAAWEEERTDGATRTSYADLRSGYSHGSRSRAGGVEGWTRALTGDSPVLAGGAEGTVQGVAMGLDAELGRGFHFGVAALPDMAASSRPGPASGLGASLEGGWYAARGGWSGRTLFAKTSVSHGRWRARSLFENSVAGGVLGGSHDLVQDHVGVKAGARLALGGMRATPSVSMYSGQVDQSAYTAQGAALRAEVPGLSQRYRGWKAGLALAPSRWLGRAGALRWRPTLHVSTMRTRTADTGVFDLYQSDRAGVLSFTSRARAQGMPGTVHALGASVTAMRSEGWRLRLGYAGMEVDGEPVHAVAARLQVRF